MRAFVFEWVGRPSLFCVCACGGGGGWEWDRAVDGSRGRRGDGMGWCGGAGRGVCGGSLGAGGRFGLVGVRGCGSNVIVEGAVWSGGGGGGGRRF